MRYILSPYVCWVGRYSNKWLLLTSEKEIISVDNRQAAVLRNCTGYINIPESERLQLDGLIAKKLVRKVS